VIITALPIAGTARIDPAPHTDARGRFARVFCRDEFAQHGLAVDWVQGNVSLTHDAGTVRGLHVQRPPAAEAKLVRCVAGELVDVLVDLRADSPTFGQVHMERLLPWVSVYVPPGVAHGFQTLVADVELAYLHSAAYAPAHEAGIRWDDPALGIRWPLPVRGVSPRDAALPLLADVEPIVL
jgi:dTDP-4-dehydrorhamnose 3,5-epimerase